VPSVSKGLNTSAHFELATYLPEVMPAKVQNPPTSNAIAATAIRRLSVSMDYPSRVTVITVAVMWTFLEGCAGSLAVNRSKRGDFGSLAAASCDSRRLSKIFVPQKAHEHPRGSSAGPYGAFPCFLGIDACNGRPTQVFNMPEIRHLHSRNLPAEIGPDPCPPLQGECRPFGSVPGSRSSCRVDSAYLPISARDGPS
jgi:hypothetical protein